MELGSRTTDFNTRAPSKLTFFNRNAHFFCFCFVLFCFFFFGAEIVRLTFFELLRECLCLKNLLKRKIKKDEYCESSIKPSFQINPSLK